MFFPTIQPSHISGWNKLFGFRFCQTVWLQPPSPRRQLAAIEVEDLKLRFEHQQVQVDSSYVQSPLKKKKFRTAGPKGGVLSGKRRPWMIYDDLIDLHMLSVSSCWFKKMDVSAQTFWRTWTWVEFLFSELWGNEKSLLGGVLRGHLIYTHNNFASFTVVSLDFSKCSLCHMYVQIFPRITGPLKEIFVVQFFRGDRSNCFFGFMSIMAKSFPVLQHLVAPGYWYILQQHHAIHMQPSIFNQKILVFSNLRFQPNLIDPQATPRWHVPEGAAASTVWPEQITKQGRIATHQKVWLGGLGLMGQKKLEFGWKTRWNLAFLKIKKTTFGPEFVTQKLEEKKKTFLLAINFSGFSPPIGITVLDLNTLSLQTC